MADEQNPGDPRAPGDAGPAGEGSARDAVNRELETLRRDFAKLRADVTDLLRTAADAGREQATETRQRLRAEAQERLDRLGEGVDRLRAEGQRRVGELEEQIERHPLMSVAIAFGVGLLFGAIWRGNG